MKTFRHSYYDLYSEQLLPKEPTALEKAVNKYRRRKKQRQLRILIAIFLIIVSLSAFILFCPGQAKELAFQITSFDLIERSSSAAIENNFALQENLKNWNRLTNDEKEHTAEKLMEAELYELHVPYKVTIKLHDYSDSLIATARGKTIRIDLDYLETCNATSIINTVAHECRHVFQTASFDIRQYHNSLFADFEPSNEKAKLFFNRFYYIHSGIGASYRTQPIEADAFAYGDIREVYYEKLLNL